jgi:hypothetical protein
MLCSSYIIVCLFTSAAWHIKPGTKTTVSSTAIADGCVMSVLVSSNSFWYSENYYIMYSIKCGCILYIDCITALEIGVAGGAAKLHTINRQNQHTYFI